MYGVAAPAATRPIVAELEYGKFNDYLNQFVVRATSTVPDVLRVYCLNRGDRGRWVAVITGLGTLDVDATWCGMWERSSAAWRRCCIAEIFRCYYDNEPTFHRIHPLSGPVLAGAR